MIYVTCRYLEVVVHDSGRRVLWPQVLVPVDTPRLFTVFGLYDLKSQ